MFEDDFLEAQYEDLNGGAYVYDSRDFDESWDSDEYEGEYDSGYGIDELDLVEL